MQIDQGGGGGGGEGEGGGGGGGGPDAGYITGRTLMVDGGASFFS